MSRIPFCFSCFSVFYVETNLIFATNQRQRVRSLVNVAILFLSFKRAITAPNKLTDSQHYKRHIFLKTVHYFKMIQRLAISLPDLH